MYVLLTRHRCQQHKVEPQAAGICGGPIKCLSHEKNHVIIFTYPPNLENIFIFSLELGYSIGLHVYAETYHLPSPVWSISTTSIEQACNCTSMAVRIHEASSRLGRQQCVHTESLSALA